jgi:hypothetical protein
MSLILMICGPTTLIFHLYDPKGGESVYQGGARPGKGTGGVPWDSDLAAYDSPPEVIDAMSDYRLRPHVQNCSSVAKWTRCSIGIRQKRAIRRPGDDSDELASC